MLDERKACVLSSKQLCVDLCKVVSDHNLNSLAELVYYAVLEHIEQFDLEDLSHLVLCK